MKLNKAFYSLLLTLSFLAAPLTAFAFQSSFSQQQLWAYQNPGNLVPAFPTWTIGSASTTGRFSNLTLTTASTTQFSVFQRAYFGGTATSTFNSAGALTLASPLAIASGGTATTTQVTNGVNYVNSAGLISSDASLTYAGGPSGDLNLNGTVSFVINHTGTSLIWQRSTGEDLMTWGTSSNHPGISIFRSDGVSKLFEFSGNNRTLLLQNSMTMGIGASTTPSAFFVVAGSAGGTTQLAAISTSTPNSTTTVFAIDATGNIMMTPGGTQVTIGDLNQQVTGGQIIMKQGISGTSQPSLLITGMSSGIASITTSSGSLRSLQLGNTSSGGMKVYVAGGTGPNQLAVGTTTPFADLQATISAANSTTTVEFGKASQNKGTCIKVYDDTGAAAYLYVHGTTLNVTTTACASVTGF